MFHCVLRTLDVDKTRQLRAQLAEQVAKAWDGQIPGLMTTVSEMLISRGWTKERGTPRQC
jgi:hypothetical protein